MQSGIPILRGNSRQVDQPAELATVIEPVSWRGLLAVARLQKRAFRPRLAYRLPTLLTLWLVPQARFLVARRGDDIVGCAIGDRHGQTSRVVNICVDPECRRQGVGSALLRALEEALPQGDMVLMVEAENDAARALYKEEGYTVDGLTRDYYGAGHDGIWMRKRRTA